MYDFRTIDRTHKHHDQIVYNSRRIMICYDATEIGISVKERMTEQHSHIHDYQKQGRYVDLSDHSTKQIIGKN